MLGMRRGRVNEDGLMTDSGRTNPVISGPPKPLHTQWFKRLHAATSIFATFRPLFRFGGRWPASIPSEAAESP